LALFGGYCGKLGLTLENAGAGPGGGGGIKGICLTGLLD